MTDTTDSSNHPGHYPSPTPAPAATPLPFYQYAPEDQTQSQRRYGTEVHQHGNVPEVHAEGAHNFVDDPALRSQLQSMMGSFSEFEPMLQHQVQNASAEPSVDSLAQGSLAFAQVTGGGLHDTSSPSQNTKEQRVKVSRACDECRRKKIRCDAVDESASVSCSNCARTNLKCGFSRQPLKRGPSKGYIKELAERLNRLERKEQSEPGVQYSGGEQSHVQREVLRDGKSMDSAIVDPRTGDKRSYATAEASHDYGGSVGYAPSHPTTFPSQPSSAERSHDSMQPFWHIGPVEPLKEVAFASIDVEASAPANIDWNEAVVDEYYRLIHQTFPLLPSNKNRLRQRLTDCPASLRDGFLAALDCTLRTFPTTILEPDPHWSQTLRKANEMLARYPFDQPSTHTNSTNLVYLQTLLLMALEADNHGPATIKGQAGPSRAEWLGRAAGVAGQLEINVLRQSKESIIGGDRDSEERLSRRVWWCLFILDRWHASSTADLLKLPENSVVLLPEDQILLGESTYHLARLSFIIGHLAAILTTTKTPSTDVMSPSNPASSLLGLTLAGEIDRFRESVESVWGSLNLVHLSYHHCHLLIKRLNPETDPLDLVGHAVKIATVLNSRLTPVTPLNHHFGALSAMTLCELCDVPRTRTGAHKGLEHLGEALGTGRGLAGNLDSVGWDGAIRELVLRKLERMI